MSQRQTSAQGEASSQQQNSSRVPKQFEEVLGGSYDSYGFYNLPNGAFYDPDGYYFDKEGYDEFGGRYDSKGFYHPGEGNKHEFAHKQYYEEEEEDELVRQYEMGHQDDDDDLDPHHEKIYKEFVRHKDELDEDEELIVSPQKLRESRLESQEKLKARGSKATENSLEEVKHEKHQHHYEIGSKQAQPKNTKKQHPVDQDLQVSQMDHLNQKIESVGVKVKKENKDAKKDHHIRIGGSPHKESDFKLQPFKEATLILEKERKGEEQKAAPTKKQTKQKAAVAQPSGSKAKEVDKNIARSENEDWGKLSFF